MKKRKRMGDAFALNRSGRASEGPTVGKGLGKSGGQMGEKCTKNLGVKGIQSINAYALGKERNDRRPKSPIEKRDFAY